MKIPEVLRIGELFSGPGGLAYGARLANEEIEQQGFTTKRFQHAWAIDNHLDSVATFIRNIEGASKTTTLCKDARTISPLELKAISNIEGFAYGFPCNDFSVVGKHKGIHGKFGPLYKCGIPILEELNPIFFIAENVGGIRSANSGDTLLKIIKELSEAGIGYSVSPHFYKFEEYGIPQARHRIILVGIRKDSGLCFQPPAPTHPNKHKSAKEALSKPPLSKNSYNNEVTKQHPRVVARLKHIKAGENAWTADLPRALKLNVSGARISQIYKRLDPAKPSYTITGSGGGGTHVYHWKENRALTNRERARLQTFPDNYFFEGSKESVRRQIGMAVPPDAAQVIFVSLIKTLLKIPYKTVKNNI